MSDESSAPLIATPDYMKGRARSIHAEVVRQSSLLGRLPADRRAEWKRFRDEWVRWYSAGPNWYWGATDTSLDEFAKTARAWADLLVTHGANAPVRQPGVPQTSAQAASSNIASMFAGLTNSPFVWVALAGGLYLASRDK